MIKKITILIIIFLVNCCFGQGINDNWNFGVYASVSFPLRIHQAPITGVSFNLLENE